jgi:hypothetical protein
MKNILNKSILTGCIIASSLISCKKNTILTPNYEVTSEQVYSTPLGYKQALAKVYAAFSLTGNEGPSGQPDISINGLAEGTTDFFQELWYLQELPTDEAVIAWGDVGVPDLHQLSWTSSNPILEGMYYRSLYQITLANDFIRQSSDDMIKSHGITNPTDVANIHYYAAEARFLRAYQYWVLMDLFGSPPFVTETTTIGSIPPQTTRPALFNYVTSELKAIAPLMVAPLKNEYGRADAGAAYALLARVYLNAQVYTGTADWNNAVTYSQKVISSGYSLIGNYDNLFLADNNLNTSENIFSIEYDGTNTETYGGTTFVINASSGGSVPAAKLGTSQAWAGTRVTSNLINLFPTPPTTDGSVFPNNGNPDTRAEFWYPGQSLSINSISTFTQGIAAVKFRNVTSSGAAGSNLTFMDVDVPIFRLAEQYLIYAEAVLRGGVSADGTSNAATALSDINLLRSRAYAGSNVSGIITSSQLTLPFILDERARELYWEGFRRTDLIRYGEFTSSSYLWPYKGGVSAGIGVSDFRQLYPLPDADRSVNPNLKQNPGY